MNHFVFRIFGIVLVLVINSEIGASVAYGGDCTSNLCTDTATMRVNVSPLISEILLTTHVLQEKVALTAACEAGETNGQCSDSNAEYDNTALQCQCKIYFFVNKNNVCTVVVAALNGACDATESATDQCDIADSECRVDGTAKCLCKTTHYVDGTGCTMKKEPSVACVATSQCVTNAECDTTDTQTCVCNAGYTATPTATPTMCSLNSVVKFANLSYMYLVPVIVSMMSFLR